jgi:hypothetical protein
VGSSPELTRPPPVVCYAVMVTAKPPHLEGRVIVLVVRLDPAEAVPADLAWLAREHPRLDGVVNHAAGRLLGSLQVITDPLHLRPLARCHSVGMVNLTAPEAVHPIPGATNTAASVHPRTLALDMLAAEGDAVSERPRPGPEIILAEPGVR